MIVFTFVVAGMLLLGTVMLVNFADYREARGKEVEALKHQIDCLRTMNDSLMMRNDVLRREKAIYKALVYKVAEEPTCDTDAAAPRQVCNGSAIEPKNNILFMYSIKR